MAGYDRETALLAGQAAAQAIDDGRSWEEAMAAGRAVCEAMGSGMSSWEAMMMAQAAALGLHNYEMVLLQGKQELRRWQMKPQPDVDASGRPVEDYLDSVLNEERLSALMSTSDMVDTVNQAAGSTEAGIADANKRALTQKPDKGGGCALM